MVEALRGATVLELREMALKSRLSRSEALVSRYRIKQHSTLILR